MAHTVSGMDCRKTEAVRVCVCGAASDLATLVLHSLAAGRLLGDTQCLHLMLEDSAESANELGEQAMDLSDACYPLVMNVQARTDTHKSLSFADVVVLIMETTRLEDTASAIAGFAAALNSTPRTKQKAVIVIGQEATTAAAVLRVLSPQLSRHLVTAVDLPATFHKHTQLGRGGHLMASAVCEHVSSWWSGLQETHNVMTEINLYQPFRFPTWRLLPEIASPVWMGMNTAQSHDSEQAVRAVKAALKHLQISDVQVVASAVSCNL